MKTYEDGFKDGYVAAFQFVKKGLDQNPGNVKASDLAFALGISVLAANDTPAELFVDVIKLANGIAAVEDS